MSEGVHTPDPRHRVAAATDSARAELGGLVEVSLWSMGAAEAASTLVALTRLRSQVAELELRVARHAQTVEVGLDKGATSTTNWWAHHTRMTRTEAHRLAKLATRLGEAHEPVRAGLAAGDLRTDQAAVIVAAVDALPADLVDAGVVDRARAHLLSAAADHDAKGLRILGRRILDVVAPEVGEAHEARLLEAEEAKARAAASFSMVEDGHGRCHGKFTVPSLHGHLLRKHLLALAAPKHQAATAAAVRRWRRGSCRPGTGWGWRSASTSRPAAKTPSRTPAGCRPRWWSPSAWRPCWVGWRRRRWTPVPGSPRARRAGWRAGPGSSPPSSAGSSQVLDLGRKCRFHTEPQRVALALRDGGCTAEGWVSRQALRAFLNHRESRTCATPTTTSPGTAAEPPTSRPAGCSAPDTTPSPTRCIEPVEMTPATP